MLIVVTIPAVNNTNWTTISEISQAGTGDQYWSIGDMKSITLNGNIGEGLTLDNFETNVFILHFNYPMNNVAENNIIWGGFKTSDGINIALVDSQYSSTSADGSKYFNMNHWSDKNFGGWRGTCLRYDILGATSTAPSQYGTIYFS